ncbi:hypothetical protein [Streptomyces sp. Tue6028]|uniref:hypothetical protein n=1 Tax=Streptomyces sp. Tue6028 TaxID=2036037 RepID=UPI003D75A0A7
MLNRLPLKECANARAGPPQRERAAHVRLATAPADHGQTDGRRSFIYDLGRDVETGRVRGQIQAEAEMVAPRVGLRVGRRRGDSHCYVGGHHHQEPGSAIHDGRFPHPFHVDSLAEKTSLGDQISHNGRCSFVGGCGANSEEWRLTCDQSLADFKDATRQSITDLGGFAAQGLGDAKGDVFLNRRSEKVSFVLK